jgi:F-type H+-transporting ATPase subunit epsilon
MAFTLEIATPERLLVREEVSEVQIPGGSGYFGVLPEHAPLISELKSGVLSYVTGGQTHVLGVVGGFVEVLPDKVRVLADEAKRKDEIDSVNSQRELDLANGALSGAEDPDAALLLVERAQALVDAAKA